MTLKLGNEPGLDALVNGLANKKSPYFGRFVGKDQFGPEFGLSSSAIARMSSTLAGLGLRPGAVDPDRLYIPVSGTAAAVERAFGVRLVSYRLPGGRVAYANSAAPKIPASIAPAIDGVLGLDTVYQPQPLDHQLPASGTPTLERSHGAKYRGQPRGERGARANGLQLRHRPRRSPCTASPRTSSPRTT